MLLSCFSVIVAKSRFFAARMVFMHARILPIAALSAPSCLRFLNSFGSPPDLTMACSAPVVHFASIALYWVWVNTPVHVSPVGQVIDIATHGSVLVLEQKPSHFNFFVAISLSKQLLADAVPAADAASILFIS